MISLQNKYLDRLCRGFDGGDLTLRRPLLITSISGIIALLVSILSLIWLARQDEIIKTWNHEKYTYKIEKFSDNPKQTNDYVLNCIAQSDVKLLGLMVDTGKGLYTYRIDPDTCYFHFNSREAKLVAFQKAYEERSGSTGYYKENETFHIYVDKQNINKYITIIK